MIISWLNHGLQPEILPETQLHRNVIGTCATRTSYANRYPTDGIPVSAAAKIILMSY